MSELPGGTVTFLFTDVQGSTRLWETAPDVMMGAMAQHDEVIESAVSVHNGHIVKPRGEGDSRFVVFPRASDALAAAVQVQQGFAATEWPTPSRILVRMALHTGVAELELGDYYGSAVNRAARLRGIGHGGQTLLSQATWELVRDHMPDGADIRDMGEHKLRDLTRPEHVYQVDIDGLQGSFPSLKSLDAIPNNLPEQLTEFVGREAELQEAERLLEGSRLLTLLGPGGVGKSRLALQTAAEVSSAYEHGVYFVSLAPIDSVESIVPTIAEAVGVALSSDDDLQSQLLSYLRQKFQLLILDNFEHLHGGASLAAKILESAPGVSILAASRTKLNLSGETVLALSGLNIHWANAEEAMACEGVQMFIDAAQRSLPSFTLAEDDLEHVERILNAVQGMPLGILLAAAWIDMMPIHEIADEITDSLDFLETEMGNIPDRHRSIRAVFEYSWRLLSDTERDLFTKLSVFKGGFQRDAARTVAGASIRDLANLVNKSLLTADRESGRYSVHELLRQYAQDYLEQDATAHTETRDAHATYYATMMGEAFGLIKKADQPSAFAMIESDIENVRTAWRYATTGTRPATARAFLEPLWMLYDVRGWNLAGQTLFAEAAGAIGPSSADDESRAVRALCLSAHAWFVGVLGAPDRGTELAEEAIEILRQMGGPGDLELALQMQNINLVFTDLPKLEANVGECLALSRQTGDEWMTMLLTNWGAAGALMSGDAAAAVERGETARRYFEQTGDHWNLTWSYQALAGAAGGEGRWRHAVTLYERVLEIDLEIDFRRGVQYALNNLGVAFIELGEFEAAEGYLLRSLEISEEIGQVREMLHTLCDIAETRSRVGENAAAVELVAAALSNPASSQGSVYRSPMGETIEALRARLEAELGPAVYAEAWEHGRSEGVESLVRRLLAARLV